MASAFLMSSVFGINWYFLIQMDMLRNIYVLSLIIDLFTLYMYLYLIFNRPGVAGAVIFTRPGVAGAVL